MTNALPEILNTTPVATSRLFSIEQVDLRFSNGTETCFERLVGEGEGAVMVVPMHSDQEFMLIREYAVGVERYELSFVKGRIDSGETPEQAAHRELREEIGHDAAKMQGLATVSLTPAYSNYRTHIFLAEELFVSPLPGDEPEPLETELWQLCDLPALRQRKDFSDGRSILATFLAAERLNS